MERIDWPLDKNLTGVVLSKLPLREQAQLAILGKLYADAVRTNFTNFVATRWPDVPPKYFRGRESAFVNERFMSERGVELLRRGQVSSVSWWARADWAGLFRLSGKERIYCVRVSSRESGVSVSVHEVGHRRVFWPTRTLLLPPDCVISGADVCVEGIVLILRDRAVITARLEGSEPAEYLFGLAVRRVRWVGCEGDRRLEVATDSKVMVYSWAAASNALTLVGEREEPFEEKAPPVDVALIPEDGLVRGVMIQDGQLHFSHLSIRSAMRWADGVRLAVISSSILMAIAGVKLLNEGLIRDLRVNHNEMLRLAEVERVFWMGVEAPQIPYAEMMAQARRLCVTVGERSCVLAAQPGSVTLRDLKSGELLRTIAVPGKEQPMLALLAGERFVVATGKRLEIHHISTGILEQQCELRHPVTALASGFPHFSGFVVHSGDEIYLIHSDIYPLENQFKRVWIDLRVAQVNKLVSLRIESGSNWIVQIKEGAMLQEWRMQPRDGFFGLWHDSRLVSLKVLPSGSVGNLAGYSYSANETPLVLYTRLARSLKWRMRMALVGSTAPWLCVAASGQVWYSRKRERIRKQFMTGELAAR